MPARPCSPTGASGLEPEHTGFGDPAACPRRAPLRWSDRRESNPRCGDHGPECCSLHHGHASGRPAGRRSGERWSRTSQAGLMRPAEPPGSARRTWYARLDSNQRPPPSQGGTRSVLSYGRVQWEGVESNHHSTLTAGLQPVGLAAAQPSQMAIQGAPDRIRTCVHRVRSAALSSTELRGRDGIGGS